jgi:peptidyl-prolyl cis-trans isomerase C
MMFILYIILSGSKALTHELENKAKRDIKAEVNTVPILQHDIDMAIARFLPKISFHDTVSSERVKKAETDTLEYLINRELYFQEAKRIGLKTKSSEVRSRISSIEKSYPSRKAFEKDLKQMNFTGESLEKKIEKDILVEKLLEKEVKVLLSDEEVKEYYKENQQRFVEPRSVHLNYISIKYRPSEADFKEKARLRAEEVLKKLDDGQDFSEMARLFSDDMSRIKGGDVGYLHEGMLPYEIEKRAFSLKEGERSGIIENDMGFHIIEAVGKKPSRQVTFSEIKDRIKSELTSSYQDKRRDELIRRLREVAIIKYF